jgi:diguanylate cyclase (GGDEF)-like protein
MYLLAVTVSLALAVSVATLVPIGSRRREGMLLWALGLFLYALTYLMYGLRGQVSNFFSIGVGNTALSAGLAMFTHAMLVFQQRQWPPWRIWPPVAAVVVMLMIVDTDAVRRLTLGVILGLQAVALVVIVFQRLRVTVGRGKYLVIGGLLVAIGIFVSRVVGVAMGADQSVSVDHSSLMQTVTHMLGLVVLIFLTVGFVIMTKERADALNVVLAMRDELTQLYNRRAVFESLGQHLAAARRNQTTLSVLMLDVDNFKSLNDTFGHAAGDRVLREIASTIQNGLRAQDVAGRMGGEEFLVVLPHAKADEASRTAERLRQRIQDVDCLRRCNLKTTLSVSVGVAQFDPVRHAGGDDLIQEADQALYRAKARGRNRVELSAHSASSDAVVLA